MIVHSPLSGRYHDVSINPLNANVQQLAVTNKNCLLTEVPVLLTSSVAVLEEIRCAWGSWRTILQVLDLGYQVLVIVLGQSLLVLILILEA